MSMAYLLLLKYVVGWFDLIAIANVTAHILFRLKLTEQEKYSTIVATMSATMITATLLVVGGVTTVAAMAGAGAIVLVVVANLGDGAVDGLAISDGVKKDGRVGDDCTNNSIREKLIDV